MNFTRLTKDWAVTRLLTYISCIHIDTLFLLILSRCRTNMKSDSNKISLLWGKGIRADRTQIWLQFTAGHLSGETRISPSKRTSRIEVQVLTAASMKMAVFWVVAPCHRPYDGGRKHHWNVGNFYETTGRINPEDSRLRKSRMFKFKTWKKCWAAEQLTTFQELCSFKKSVTRITPPPFPKKILPADMNAFI
jgi:hypothetical protein